MLFQDNIPDPHVGFYSKNVLGDDAINGEVSAGSGGFVYDSWFYGYYLNGPSNGSPQTQGYLNSVTETFISIDRVNTGSSPRGGWFFTNSSVDAQVPGYLYFSINPFAFNDTKKSLWVYIENIQSWFLFDRYYCIKDSRLGLDNLDFETFTTSYKYYWIRQVLDYSGNGMTAGEGILSYANVYSGKQLGFVLLKPHGGNNLRAYYGNNSSINPIDLW